MHFVHLSAVFALLPVAVLCHPKFAHGTASSRGRGALCGTQVTGEAIAVISNLKSQDFPSALTPEQAAAANITSALRTSAKGSERLAPEQFTVQTWIHIVTTGKTLADGWIPDSQVTAQIKEMNANFATSNINFVLKGVTRTVNQKWAVDFPGEEMNMKNTLRKGDYRDLNIYLLKFLPDNLLGYAYYPIQLSPARKRTEYIHDGVTLKYSTVPGGSEFPYNLGRTATHEIGHWLGLLHTFEGGCSDSQGDLIADTPAQATPSFGCPVGADTCPGLSGLDAIHNYMDYSDDSCYEAFSPLQTRLMFSIWNTLRNPRICIRGAACT